jgi:hypothetical protein
MAARYILAVLSVIFLGLAVLGPGHGRGLRARAWLIAGLMFGAVSTWLFIRG